jgi:hypothetical protein
LHRETAEEDHCYSVTGDHGVKPEKVDLDDHGVKPEKVLKKAGLADTDWDNPDSVHALYAASTKFWPRTLRSDSDADSDADDYAAGAASDSDDSV